MAPPAASATLSPEPAARLLEFARACRAATRVVTMYPSIHPSVAAVLGRVAEAGRQAVAAGPFAITVLPDTLQVGGRGLARPDISVNELAVAMHDHLVGALTLEGPLSEAQWHTILSIVARPPSAVRSEGGITAAWLAAGGGPLTIREIDYAELLKGRADGDAVSWDRILANYLAGDDRSNLDDAALVTLLEIARDPQRLSEFFDRLQARSRAGNEDEEAARRALLQLTHGLANYASASVPDEMERLLGHLAGAAGRLSPDLMMALLTDPPPAGAAYGEAPPMDLAAELRGRLGDDALAHCVATDVEREQGATARLATVLHTLAPEPTRQARVLSLAGAALVGPDPAARPDAAALWSRALDTLAAYKDSAFVGVEYDHDLSQIQSHAVEVERVSDDPPERISAWMASIGDEDIRALDQQLLLDLLAIDTRPAEWHAVVGLAVGRIDQLVLVGDLSLAGRLIEAIGGVSRPGTQPFARLAGTAMSVLAGGPLLRHLVLFLRHASDEDARLASDVCRAVGPELIAPLVEAMSQEDHVRTARRLRDALIGFGTAARAYADELRQSVNPEARRAAIDLLRTLGGKDALPDLRSLLDDHEPQVQRDALRAIVHLGSDEAYAALELALRSGAPRARDAIMQALTSMRDERAASLFVYILTHTDHRGPFESAYTSAIGALGRVGRDAESVEALVAVLYRGEWWAPRRTARLRAAAARALRMIGSDAARRALEDAAANGASGTRLAAQASLADETAGAAARRTP